MHQMQVTWNWCTFNVPSIRSFVFIYFKFLYFQITIKKKTKVNKNKITNQKNKNSLGKIKFFIIYLAYKHKKIIFI